MAQLIALVAKQTQDLVDRIRRAWDDGNAVAVLDPTAPRDYLETLIEAIDPDRIEFDDLSIRPLRRIHELQDNAALVMCTSGTTGRPKAVVHTFATLGASAHATGEYLGVRPGEGTWICALPLSHIGGFSTITKAIYQKTSLAVFPKFDYGAIESLAREMPCYLPLVRANLSRITPKAYRRLVLGAGVAPEQLPSNASITYGLTETGSGLVYDGTPLRGVEVRVGIDGEILLRGPMIATSYRDGGAIFADDGWFHTNDAGEFSADKLIVHGRRSEMISSGGERIVPHQVESVIQGLAGVAEVAVVGVDDSEFQQIAWAFIVAKKGETPPGLETIKSEVRRVLPRYCAPRGLTIVRALPKTALGKIQKSRLGEMLEGSPPPS